MNRFSRSAVSRQSRVKRRTDPMFLAWLKACRPVLHRIVTRDG